MNFDPEAYTITIRKEVVDGEALYVARVAELPDVRAFEETHDEARSIALDAIVTLKQVADEQGKVFPAPAPVAEDEFSGRVTLRLPKSAHAKAARQSERDGVSLNQHLVNLIIDGMARNDADWEHQRPSQTKTLEDISAAAKAAGVRIVKFTTSSSPPTFAYALNAATNLMSTAPESAQRPNLLNMAVGGRC